MITIFLFAWGPHDTITRAALETLPEYNKWEIIFGKENLNPLPIYSWIPDMLNVETSSFFCNDYLLIKN